MRVKHWVIGSVVLAFLMSYLGWTSTTKSEEGTSDEKTKYKVSAEGRWAWQFERLADPVTGKIPEGIQMRELAYASKLPRVSNARDSVSVNFESIGPYNVGGRTRAFAIAWHNPQIYLAGGVSGGVWRSTDAGASWQKVTPSMNHQAVSCIEQDQRSGKQDVWYYGSGESVGNSASKSFQAVYRGSGMYKSTDGGVTWTHLQSTGALINKASRWDFIFAVETDPTRHDSDIVYAAIQNGIMRSNDGGVSWSTTIQSSSVTDFTDVHITSDGVLYASISANGGASRGFWRSEDGIEWTNITPAMLPTNHERTIIQSAPSNEDVVYFFSRAAGNGANGASLLKYEYLSGNGNGSGGTWTNLTSGMASAEYNLQGSYCQVLNVKPDDENMVFLGGTNLYRSTNGFTDTFQITRIGGYSVDGDSNYSYFRAQGKHYPDQQNLFFHPQNPDFMISTTDGGVHLAEDCTLDTMQWQSLNNGYRSSQFYAIGIDFKTAGSKVVIGGLQDRGTFWTNEADPTELWTHVRGADGAFSEVEDGGGHYYISTQYANIQRLKIDENGERSERENIMPKQLGKGWQGGWKFVHPFTLDRQNNDVMYLPNEGDIWRNDNIAATDSTELFSAWRRICSVTSDITAISSSESEEGVVYFGTSTGLVYRIDSAHNEFFIEPTNLSSDISTSGYVSNIAIDPHNSDHAIAVFANYNTISLWSTMDGGEHWNPVEGNLRGETEDGVPEQLYYIGNGPSTRWVEIVPTPSGNVYYVGTSVGLFATDSLRDDSTIWVQQAPHTIGNVVVDMMHYRESDGWLVVGTHGNGIYAGTVNYVEVSTGIAEAQLPGNSLDLKLYPNPAADLATIQVKTKERGNLTIELFDQQGRTVRSKTHANQSNAKEYAIQVGDLSRGLYFVNVRLGSLQRTEQLILR